MRARICPKELTDYVFGRFPLVYQQEDARLGQEAGTRIAFVETDGGAEWRYFRPEMANVLRTETRGPLYRYLLSIFSTAGAELLRSIEGLWDAAGAQASPDGLFPHLYECFGLPFFNDIPLWFQRKLLTVLGEMYMRKGTRGAVAYLAREVTGFGAEVVDLKFSNFRAWSPYAPFALWHVPSKTNASLKSPDAVHRLAAPAAGGAGRVREVLLVLTAPMGDEAAMKVKEKVLLRFLAYFMPFDVRWSVLTKWRFETEWGMAGGEYESRDEISVRSDGGEACVSETWHGTLVAESAEERGGRMVKQAAATNFARGSRLNENWMLANGDGYWSEIMKEGKK